MAQSVAEAEKRKPLDDVEVIDVDNEHLQPKRLKQGRLPFKILDCKPVNPSPVLNNAVKKRKLSGPDSPNSKAKQPKVPDLRNSAEKSKSARLNNDNEVSSSSEAENLPISGGKSRATKNNLLEKFVRREDEITSTNDVIDLTDAVTENEQDENLLVSTKSPEKSVSKLPDKQVSKEKPEDHFARKLVFDEKVTNKNETAYTEEECELKENLSKDEQNKLPSVAALLESEFNHIDLCENDGKSGLQADKSADTSVFEDSYTSEAETSVEDGSSTKTPVSKIGPLSTSTPDTSETTSKTDNAEQKASKKKKIPALQQKMKEDKMKEKQMAKEKKEKEKLEKKKQREEERAEKERAKQEEKERKEKERLVKKEQAEKEKQEKLQQKEEEKRRKQELLQAKEEEKRKKAEEKEEEKKLKEEQKLKEEEDKQRLAEKRKAAFTSFFIKPKTVTSTKVDKTADNLFIPFTLKKDMTLAPVRRRVLSTDAVLHLDRVLRQSQEMNSNFLMELRQGVKKPVRTNRILRKKVEVEQEVEMLVHDEDAVKKSMHAVKLLQFHTDYRPPYYGTWTRKVTGLSPRNPWKKEESGVFDYEIDSDDEWEEEEPGESLSDSNGEEEEGDEEEDGVDEDGWMVPHGYLSEDEVCEEDEEVTPEALKARQRAKAQAWEMELKAKKMMAPPIHFGCFLLDNPCTDAHHLTILRQFEMICLRTTPLETLISNPDVLETGDKIAEKVAAKTTPGSKGFRKRALPEEAMPDLIRLVHGNTVGIKKLVREFRLYWKQKSSDTDISLSESQLDDDTEGLDKSVLDTSTITTDKAGEGKAAENLMLKSASEADTEKNGREHEVTDTPKRQRDSEAGEDATDSCVSKRQLEMKINAIAEREKREGSKKHCWYVRANILKQYNLDHLPLENSWHFVSGDMSKNTSSMAEKKIPNDLMAEKKTPSKKFSGKKRKSTAGPEVLITPLKEKPSSDTEGTPKAGMESVSRAGKEGTPKARTEGTPKSCRGKEASAKKTQKDQPSIMAFAKKGKSKHSQGDEVGNVSGLEINVDADLERDCSRKESELTRKSTYVEKIQKKGDNDVLNIEIPMEQETGVKEEVSDVQKTEASKEHCNMETEYVKQDDCCNSGEIVSSTIIDVDMETEQKELVIPDKRLSTEYNAEQRMKVGEVQKEGHDAQKIKTSDKQQKMRVTQEQAPMVNVDEDCIILD